MTKVKKSKKDELIPTRRSIHVVYLSCPHCSHEMDDVKLCPECSEPMRVIDVVEKFGEDAERFIKRLEKRKEQGKNGESISSTDQEEEAEEIDSEEPNIILLGVDDSIDDGIDPFDGGDDHSLDVIFPDDSGSTEDVGAVSADDDLAMVLEQLDSEEEENITAEDFGFDDGEIPEL